MGQDAVQKGYHCAYQLHYHIVFPVKYRKALLSEAITQAIKEIALGIQERYEIEIERIQLTSATVNDVRVLKNTS